MRTRWDDSKAAHLPEDRQEKMAVAWARLRLIDKYETDFARQKRTMNLSHHIVVVQARRHSGHHEDAPSIGESLEDRSEKSLSDLDRNDIEAMIEKLSDVQRNVTKLLLYEGLTQQEAAKQLGVTQAAVNQAYERARESLREQLRPFAEK